MSPEQVFSLANAVAALCWLTLAVLPRKAWVSNVAAGVAVPAMLAFVYAILIGVNFWSAEGSFSSLAGVALLFRNPWLLLAGWIHYLAFDLLVGSWEARDARQRGIPHLLLLPCLIMTFLFGPAGWLLYLGMRSAIVNRPAG